MSVDRERSSTSRRPLAIAAGLAAAVGLLLATLMLLDVLPGGWRLRTLFVPQAVQDFRRRAAHRAARLEGFRAEPLPAPGGTLFMGSSTIERFPLAGDLAGDLAPFAPINRGIGDEDLNGLEARALATVRRLKPSVVVLYAGSVNVRRPVDDGSWTPPETIVRRAGSLARGTLAEPGVKAVILLGILPERTTGPELRERLVATNQGLAALAREEGIVFLPLATPALVTQNGNLRPELAADELHLNAAGYRVLGKRLAVLLSELREGPPLGSVQAPR